MSIRARLTLLVLTTLIHALTLCWLTIKISYESEKRENEDRVSEATNMLRTLIDQELAIQLMVAKLLASVADSRTELAGELSDVEKPLTSASNSTLDAGDWASL